MQLQNRIDIAGADVHDGIAAARTNRATDMTAIRAHRVPVLDVTIPVYNEERALADSVGRLDDYLTASFPFTYPILPG